MANSTPIPVDSNTSGWEPTVQDQINLALATNGGIKRIEAVMQQRLDEAGWTQSLKEYVTRLLRSGEATTYDECLAKVMAAVNAKEGANGVNGAGGGGTQAPDLRMSEDAKQDAATAVKKEIKPLLVEKTEMVPHARRRDNCIGTPLGPELLYHLHAHYPYGHYLHAWRREPAIECAPFLATEGCLQRRDGSIFTPALLGPSHGAKKTIQSPVKSKTVRTGARWIREEDSLLLTLKTNPTTRHMPWRRIQSIYFQHRTQNALIQRWKKHIEPKWIEGLCDPGV